MKKPTIASLQAQVAAREAKVTSAQVAEQTWKTSHYDTLRDLRSKQSEIDTQRRELEAQVKLERSARERAEGDYDRHRSAVLCYFMAEANPETAKDKARLVELQQTICGIIPPRTPEPISRY